MTDVISIRLLTASSLVFHSPSLPPITTHSVDAVSDPEEVENVSLGV